MDRLFLLQWIGCAFGVAGAAALAMRKSWSGIGFLLFLISNILWAAFAVLTESHGLLWQQIAFTVTSLAGIRNWIFPPASG
ncbi:MAG: hypothetical protein OEL20_05080 [Sulfuritalea sp.]|nr:hypothetical protein [Sulfuritalea sp.]